MLLAQHAREPGVSGEAFNVTAGAPVSVLDLVETVVKVSGKRHLQPVVQATDLSQQGTYEHLSSEKIQRVLGWKPRFSLEEGVRLTYQWYAKHGLGWLG